MGISFVIVTHQSKYYYPSAIISILLHTWHVAIDNWEWPDYWNTTLASCQFHRRSLLRTFGPEKTSGSFGICGICVKAVSGWPLKDSYSYSNWWNRPKGVGRKSIKERHYSCIVLEFFRGSMVCRLDHMVTHGKSSSGARFGSLWWSDEFVIVSPPSILWI